MALDIFTETTQKEILAKLQLTNAYLSAISGATPGNVDISTYADIQKIVQSGLAEKVFAIGQQINTTWTDVSTGTAYDCPMDIVHFGDVELEDGSIVPGMFLQTHWASYASLQFDAPEAFYVATEDLPAGDYYFTLGTTYGTGVSGDIIQFTADEDIPSGSQFVFSSNTLDGASIYVYASGNDTTASQTMAASIVEEGSGTDLGTFASTKGSNFNHKDCALYGYNRWSQSAYRQYLNSAAEKSEWWTAQNAFDRPCSQHGTYPGFLTGFADDFLGILKPVKVTTALSTVTDSAIGATEDTYDTFFLPSVEQMYGSPQLADVEGPYWKYWKEATGLDSPSSANNTGRITYAINSVTSAQLVRLRSAYRGIAYYVWYVNTAGSVGAGYTISACRSAPGCVVC